MLFCKYRIYQIRDNKRWQVTTINTGKVLSSHKQWRKAINSMIMEQRRAINLYGGK